MTKTQMDNIQYSQFVVNIQNKGKQTNEKYMRVQVKLNKKDYY